MKRIASPQKVKELLEEYGLDAKKSFGQNFLIEDKAVDEIIEALEPKKEELVIEIGPGLGALTEALLEKDSKVVAIELDRDMAMILNKELARRYNNLEVINKDFLKSKWYMLKAPKIVGNLPYYITTPILMEIFQKETPWQRLVFTIQWEVAKKLTAAPSTKDYAQISVVSQCLAEVEIIAKFPPHYFLPQPEVSSAVVLLKRRTPYLDSLLQQKLLEIISLSFTNRRKTLRNNLKSIIPQGWQSPIDLDRRAESLNYEEFITLAQKLTYL